MWTFRSLVCCIFAILFPTICFSQYDDYYKIEKDIFVTTKQNSILNQLPSTYNNINEGNANFTSTREYFDIGELKSKKIKQPQELKVLRYTNTILQDDFNAYVVEYKNQLWVLESRYAQDNSLLNLRNSQLSLYKEDLLSETRTLNDELDSLNYCLDSLVATYTNECNQNIIYYKDLLSRLPEIRDSLVLAEEARKKEFVDKRYNEWYMSLPASTKKAADAIFVTYAKLSSPNSAGGCDYDFHYINNSSKTIKYLYWTGVVYNAVNDPVKCIIRGYSTCTGQDTGPIKTGEDGGGTWGCIIYNSSADTMKLNNIRILYMDGSSFSIGGTDIKRLLKRPSRKVYVDTYEVWNKVITESKCQEKIDIWESRLNNIQENNFTSGILEKVFKDNSYNQNWELLQAVQSELQKTQNKVSEMSEKMYKFIKFINFK